MAMAGDGKEKEDRISELPDHLLNHILSFFPSLEDAVRTSCLSKRWRNLWVNIPISNFQNLSDLEMFLNTQRLTSKGHNSFLKFKLFAYNYVHKEDTIETLFNSFLQTNTVKVFHLSICPSYSLPQSVINNAKSNSLTVLSLEGINLNPKFHTVFPSLEILYLNRIGFQGGKEFPISSPSLKKLSMNNMDLKEITLQNLICGCPLIENLQLSGITSLSGLDLRFFRQVKSLLLANEKVNEKWLKHLVLQLPLLEKLTLRHCDDLIKFKIYSQSLKSFYCVQHFSGTVAKFRTPNLDYFGYEGIVKSIFQINSLYLLEASVKLDPPGKFQLYNRSWYFALLTLLSNLNCKNALRINAPSGKALLIPVTSKPLFGVKHLRVKIKKAHDKHKELSTAFLRNALFWCAPSLETLKINYY